MPTPSELVWPRLVQSFGLYDDLIAALPTGALSLDLPGLPSNRIGQQLWCVIGARESYARAIAAGSWQGFTCGLTRSQTLEPAAVAERLRRAASQADTAIGQTTDWTPDRVRLLMSLLEHEVQHHGQLIRYLYGNRLPIPASWKERYTLD